jgi:hypothetical protein
MEISMEVPQNLEIELPYEYTTLFPDRISQHTIEIPTHPYLLWHNSQQPSCRIRLGAHHWMNG